MGSWAPSISGTPSASPRTAVAKLQTQINEDCAASLATPTPLRFNAPLSTDGRYDFFLNERILLWVRWVASLEAGRERDPGRRRCSAVDLAAYNGGGPMSVVGCLYNFAAMTAAEVADVQAAWTEWKSLPAAGAVARVSTPMASVVSPGGGSTRMVDLPGAPPIIAECSDPTNSWKIECGGSGVNPATTSTGSMPYIVGGAVLLLLLLLVATSD